MMAFVCGFNHRLMRRYCIVSNFVLFLLSCGIDEQPRIAGQPVELPAAVQNVRDMYWLPDGGMILQAESGELWYQAVQAEIWKQVPLPNDPNCLVTDFVISGVLPDGRVHLAKICSGNWQDKYGVYHGINTDLGYDLATGQLVPLTDVAPRLLAGTSWRPDMQKAVLMTTYGFSTLYWTDGNTLEPVAITLTDGDQSWYLPDSIPALERYLTDPAYDPLRTPNPVGEINGAIWSPTSDQIAIWANLDMIGQPRQSPLTSKRWNLYLLNPETQHVELVLEGVIDAGGGAWSPDGQWFAAGTRRGKSNPAGLWLLSVSERKVVPIADGIFGQPNWSPDGTSLLVTRCTDDTCLSSDVWLYDVSSIVGKL